MTMSRQSSFIRNLLLWWYMFVLSVSSYLETARCSKFWNTFHIQICPSSSFPSSCIYQLVCNFRAPLNPHSYSNQSLTSRLPPTPSPWPCRIFSCPTWLKPLQSLRGQRRGAKFRTATWSRFGIRGKSIHSPSLANQRSPGLQFMKRGSACSTNNAPRMRVGRRQRRKRV